MNRPHPPSSIASLALLLCATACGSTASPKPRDDRPRVVAQRPGDELARADAAVTLVFDRAMVNVEAVGPALAALPVRVEPALRLRAHWEDAKTLQISPETEWEAGQRYTLVFEAAFAAGVAEPHRFVIDVQPLRLSWLTSAGENVAREPEFDAIFSLPVARADALSRCVLLDAAGGRVALRERAATQHEGFDPHRVHLAVSQRLALETAYRLACPGLQPAGGGAPWRDQPGVGRFTTHGLLELARGWPASDPALPPEQATLCLELTTPVSREQLAKHVRVSPLPEGLAEAWYEGGCGELWTDGTRANAVLLAARRSYSVTLDAELTDVFGQKLGKPRQWTFRTSDRIPGLWTLTGAGSVLEYGRSGHAVGALNLKHAALTCTSLSASQFAAGFSGFSAWTFEPHDRAPDGQAAKAPWQALGLTPRVHALDTAAAANAARVSPIDLGARCGLGAGAPGLYAVELTPGARSVQVPGRQGDAPARLLANVTDLGVVAKRGERSALVWVTRLSTGAVVARADVELLDPTGRVVAGARTDARGLARFERLPPAAEDSGFFAVRSGDDVAVVGLHWLWRDGLQSWQLGVRESHEDDAVRLFVHTDRGVYRPGERVYVHGLVRRIGDRAAARVPDERSVELELSAGRETLYRRTLELSDFGSFAAEIDLPAHVAPGSHSLRISAAGKIVPYEVRVAEFKPLTFELVGGPARDEVLAGEPVELELEARYLFGAPLANAALRFSVERTPDAVRAPDFAEFSFQDSAPALPDEEPLPESPVGIVLERELRTDARGKAQLEFPSAAERSPTRYLITAEASDAAQDRTTRSFSVLAHSAERYAGARMSRWLFGPNEPVRAEVVLVDRAGRPVSGEAEIELRSERWECGDPLMQCTPLISVLEKRSVRVTAAKPAEVVFAARSVGSVHVRAVTHDAAGRPARASASAWIHGNDGAGPYNDRVAAPLSVDRRAYRIGERAQLALQTPLAPAQLLVTAERADILSAQVVDARAGMPAVTFGAAAAPNTFVTLTGMTPRSAPGEAGRPRLVAGAREVRVDGPSRVLACEIELAREQYEPGERVAGQVRVTHLGRPVQAEVALVAVNESVLQLTGFATPDPTAIFHAPRGLSVRTASNVQRVVADPSLAARVPDAARLQEGQDGGGGRPGLRDDYVAAAYFAPALRTDAQGRVRFEFDAPSDLSAYRLMAVVAARDDRVGSDDARFAVRKPLSARPLVPRFASRGDTLELGALVHDHTGVADTTAVRFDAAGLALEQSALQLAPAGAPEQLARTRGVVADVEQAWFEVEVRKGAHTDRVRRTLSVRQPLDSELRVLALARSAKVEAELQWPAGIDPERSQLEISIDRAGLAPLAPALAALLDYPYGCTEQTAAAIAAVASAPELATAIVPELASAERLRAHIAEGVARVMQARNPDGGFGLYPGMGGRIALTALVLESGLAARSAGFMVPGAMTTEAAAALAAWLGERKVHDLSRDELATAAHAALLLRRAGVPASAIEDQLWPERARLSLDAAAQLLHALALRGGHDARRAELRARLAGLSWLRRARDSEMPFSSPERTSALALSALLADAHDLPLQSRLVTFLTARATDPEVQLSTRDIADTLAALASWARKSQAGGSHVRVGLGKQVLYQGPLTGAQVIALTRAASTAPQGRVWVEADADVSVSIRRRDVSKTAPKPSFAHGLDVQRRYVHPESGKPLTELAIGDVVQVELELRSERAVRMAALVDPLPAGLEPLDPELASGRLAGCGDCNDASVFDHVRRHDDRIEAFAEWLPAGKHVLRYALRATLAGTFSVPGATAELMYMPELYGRSSVDRFRVKR